MRNILLLTGAGLAAMSLAPSTFALPLGSMIPANCVEHVPFDGGADAAGDLRCAGLPIAFHVDGAARSPFPIWAGQWLFQDANQQFRVGSCTFNRGVHPNVLGPSLPVEQAFPNDPTGEKRAYLTWRYGDTTDNLTAAAVWAVAHYYAQDAAGTNRSPVGTAPLIADLGRISEMTANQQLEDLAIALDAEAERHRGPFGLGLLVDPSGSVRVFVNAGSQPVAGVPIAVHVSGDDQEHLMTTLADGSAETVIVLPSGATTVSAVAAVPGTALVYQGPPASPDPHGAQTLLTGGDPSLLTAQTTIDIPEPTTTIEETTTTVPETTVPETTTTVPDTTTTVPETTTTVPETTTTELVTTVPPSTEPEPPLPPDTVPDTTVPPEPSTTVGVEIEAIPTTTLPAPVVQTVLPKTGGSGMRSARLAVAALVVGIGLVGSSRRPRSD